MFCYVLYLGMMKGLLTVNKLAKYSDFKDEIKFKDDALKDNLYCEALFRRIEGLTTLIFGFDAIELNVCQLNLSNIRITQLLTTLKITKQVDRACAFEANTPSSLPISKLFGANI